MSAYRRRRWSMAGATVAWTALATAGLAGPGSAQAGTCGEGRLVGSLGVTSIRCQSCRFHTDGESHRATFWTEPTLLRFNPEAPASRVLEEGDVLVAVDGELITTRRGSERFSNLPASGDVPVRVRRNGRALDLLVPVWPVCASEPPAPPNAGGARVAPPSPPAPAGVAVPRVDQGAGAVVVVAPDRPPAPVAAPAPLPPGAIGPRARLGFSFRCSDCSVWTRRGEDGERAGVAEWHFSEPPEVYHVEMDGPAAAALQSGDQILEVDGQPITDSGGLRFARIQPGDRVHWTVRRDGERLSVWTVALERADPAPISLGSRSRDPLRFSGNVGPALVEVRGGAVNVIEQEGGREIIIRSADLEVRIRVPAGSR